MSKQKIDSELFEEIVSYAESKIAHGTINDWINISALIRRAYYLGIFNSLEKIAEENDLDRLGIKILQKTMYQQEIDQIIKDAIDAKENQK